MPAAPAQRAAEGRKREPPAFACRLRRGKSCLVGCESIEFSSSFTMVGLCLQPDVEIATGKQGARFIPLHRHARCPPQGEAQQRFRLLV